MPWDSATRYRNRGAKPRSSWPKAKTTERGLGAEHQARRAELITLAIGQPCPGPYRGPRSKHCTRILLSPARVDLDEDPPRALGTPVRWRLCCSPCNRSAGGRIGAQVTNAKRRARRTALPTW